MSYHESGVSRYGWRTSPTHIAHECARKHAKGFLQLSVTAPQAWQCFNSTVLVLHTCARALIIAPLLSYSFLDVHAGVR